MRKRLTNFLSLLFFCTACNAEELNVFVQEALANNPRIKASYSQWQAAQEKAPQVSSLPDPMLRYEYMKMDMGAVENTYGISQKIPFPAKLSTRARAANMHAEVMREKYEGTRQEVIKNLKFMYYDIYWVDKAIQITKEEEGILENLSQVARRRYETGKTHQQDVIKAEVELSKLLDRLYTLKQCRLSLVSNLNSILARPAETGFGTISDMDVERFNYGLDELKGTAKNTRQELLGAGYEIEKAEYERSLARLEYIPDIMVGFDITDNDTMNTEDSWMGMVGINLPVWFPRLGAHVREKEELLEASKRQYEDLNNKVIFEVEDLFFKINTYFDIVELYRTALMPQTEQSFEAAATGYETGHVDFLNWLDSERVLLQTRLAYYKAIVDYKKSIAFMERIVGKELEG